MSQTLEQKISAFIDLGNELPKVESYIRDNLNKKFELRPYQNEAFERLFYYINNKKLCQKPAQLLFHMATGSGKTLIMAGAILYLYKKGYKNFLFFVNSTNIINKTRDNFLNSASYKYLFAETISIGGKIIQLKEVTNFQSTNDDCINIVFSTIQGLHSQLNIPRENSITYDDFVNKKIALISDEAHHINVDTKKGKLSVEDSEEFVSWETTVNRIFRSNNQNILLEFTATIDLSIPEIASKYSDKIVFNYPLKQFRLDGYSKEVKVFQSDVPLMQRALQAVLISQYRRKIFEKYKNNIKPVLLFKSKTITDSKVFYSQFIESMKKLTNIEIKEILKNDEPSIKKCSKYLISNGITIENFIEELKSDFAEEKCIEVNSKEESEQKQIAVNTLENDNNEYRVIFAVDKLNEGWDVLNLFDIVRLYETRDSDTKTGKPGKTTIAEAQLIGRGARYCPFQINDTQLKYQRKYDNDLDNELRICEELYYHSAYNPKYIHELHNALHEIGIKEKTAKEIQLELKEEFKETDFYRSEFIFKNEQIRYDRSELFALPNTITEKLYKYNIQSGVIQSSLVFENYSDKTISKKIQKDYTFFEFGVPIIRKALAKIEFYQFRNLKSYLPNLKSISEFITSRNYLGKIRVEVDGLEDSVTKISNTKKLNIAIHILKDISDTIQSTKIEYQGTKEFLPFEVSKIFKDKRLNIVVNSEGDQEYGIPQSETSNKDLRMDLSKKNWYVFSDNYGTSEEKYLVKFIDKAYEKLKLKYSEIYLVRNEKHFQIYNFDDGKPFEPDFVLFLKSEIGDENLHYQLFIEPKGEHLLEHDAWKEDFLKKLKLQHRINVLWKSKKYTLWGMPFYNEKVRKVDFEKAFLEITD